MRKANPQSIPEPTPEPAPQTQGRPRSKDAHDAVLEATNTLLEQLDYPNISVDKIVLESSVSKRTIYRWWRNKASIILEVISADDITEPNTGNLEKDLTQLLSRIFKRVSGDKRAQVIKGLVMDAQYDPEFATQFRDYIHSRRQVCLNILERGQQRGEISAKHDPALIADLFYGAYWYRFLIGHAPLTDAYAKDTVKMILNGIR
jgi:AcrR family transcriptional regulator